MLMKPVKIEVEKNENIFARNGKWTARFGKWEEYADTKKETKEKLINAMNWYFEQKENTPAVIWNKNKDTCFILMLSFSGYSYIIANNKRRESSCIMGRISYKEAYKRMEGHAEQYNT